MSGTTDTVKLGYQCPICGNVLPHLAAIAPFDAPCSECGYYLWCRRRNSADGVVLEAVSGRAPEPSELGKVIHAISREGPHVRVTVDLSRLEMINCSFLAALVRMNKRLAASGCTLVLCGLNPNVAEIFDRLRLNRLFDIVSGEQQNSMCA
jgi:anti-anti-sigma factor